MQIQNIHFLNLAECRAKRLSERIYIEMKLRRGIRIRVIIMVTFVTRDKFNENPGKICKNCRDLWLHVGSKQNLRAFEIFVHNF